MELDRELIERDDFSSARRGYDPDEVDRHLRAIADAVEELRRERRSAAAPAAASASEQVRTIVEAAERSAAELESAARGEAERIRAEAERDASRARARAAEEAAGHVDRVREAAARMLERAEAIERALGEWREEAGALPSAAAAEPEPAERAGPEHDLGAGPEHDVTAPGDEDAAVPVEEEIPARKDDAAQEGVRAPQDEDVPAAGEGSEGARLIALNMALGGSPREEVARYLDENFELDDPEGLLDEVYARAGA